MQVGRTALPLQSTPHVSRLSVTALGVFVEFWAQKRMRQTHLAGSAAPRLNGWRQDHGSSVGEFAVLRVEMQAISRGLHVI
jgi:hypothetical protein